MPSKRLEVAIVIVESAIVLALYTVMRTNVFFGGWISLSSFLSLWRDFARREENPRNFLPEGINAPRGD